MANVPDFTVKTKPLDAGTVAQILQRKAEIENQQNQQALNNSNDRTKRIMDAITTGQQVASNMMTLAEKRQNLNENNSELAGQQKVQSLLTTPPPTAPAPTASSSALPDAGTFPVQPSPEQNQGYADQMTKRKNDLVSALIQSNPKQVTQDLAKSQLTPPKDTTENPTFQSKSVLYNGEPKEVIFNPKNSNYYDPVTKAPLTGKIEPYNAMTAPTDLTDADRKRLGPLAQAVIEGRATPGALVNARGSDKAKLSQLAAEKDPTFDLSLAPQRIAVRKDFAPAGKSGQALTSLNTVIGHLDTLDQKINALDNGQITKLNSIKNYALKNVGKPEVSGFLATKGLVNAEMAKIAQGSGIVSNEERGEFSNALDTASSPAQAHEVISTWMDLMKSRTDALKANWKQTMGDLTPPTPFINDKSKAKLVKHGYNPDTLEKTGASSDRPPLDSFFK